MPPVAILTARATLTATALIMSQYRAQVKDVYDQGTHTSSQVQGLRTDPIFVFVIIGVTNTFESVTIRSKDPWQRSRTPWVQQMLGFLCMSLYDAMRNLVDVEHKGSARK